MASIHLAADTPIFHKIYHVYKLLYSLHPQIPRIARYTIWQKCENTTLEMLEKVIEIGGRKDAERLSLLRTLSDKLDLLKVLMRLAKETRAIDEKSYLAVQTELQEAGKMIGGWVKSVPR